MNTYSARKIAYVSRMKLLKTMVVIFEIDSNGTMSHIGTEWVNSDLSDHEIKSRYDVSEIRKWSFFKWLAQ